MGCIALSCCRAVHVLDHSQRRSWKCSRRTMACQQCLAAAALAARGRIASGPANLPIGTRPPGVTPPSGCVPQAPQRCACP